MSVTQNSTSSPVATRLASMTHPTWPGPNSENVERVEHVWLQWKGLWARLRLRSWLFLSALVPLERLEYVERTGLRVRRWS